jgi:hypothetical protein
MFRIWTWLTYRQTMTAFLNVTHEAAHQIWILTAQQSRCITQFCADTRMSKFFLVVKGPAADATDAPQPWGLLCNPVMKMSNFFPVFPCNGAPVEWNWQGKIEVLGEKPVPVSLFPPQIPHGQTRDRTRASAVRDRRLTAWAMTRPNFILTVLQITCSCNWYATMLCYTYYSS